MGVRANGAVSKLSPGDSPRGHAAPPIPSLNEAWLHALDKCAIDNPLTETILPLMRNRFFRGRCTRFCCCRRVMATSWLPILRASSSKSRSRDTQSLTRTA
jgi:hypothetical protein